MAVARYDLGRAARKRGIEGQVTIIPHFGIRCVQGSAGAERGWVITLTNLQNGLGRVIFHYNGGGSSYF